ncbi:6-phosphofructokinase [Candidatus Mycoplasma mahonii]|uniref:6-phosphofructokinase n=1 Tax=Candidatus Mycoplasma mahonii TaxID=3004105 RepID=UPI0026EDE512|nr:6-phosphofructokinase [Candidatus Mycoplasma mahonii]WKX02563.1 6-phosphofructokinase [Candidatus Mycoplasma mahonii]
MIKKIAILTSGGDAPGMNNAIRAIVKTAKINNVEPFLVYEGYSGLYKGDIISASDVNVDQYISKGGTFIYSARFPKFLEPKIREVAKNNLKKMGIDALVVIGGDGSYRGAQRLHELGVKTIALPGTIDNDITSSDFTIGYNTALNTVVENVEKIRDTMNSHGRAAIIEVMGHGCGDLALYGGIATGVEIIVTNEVQMSIEKVAQKVKEQKENGKRSVIVLISEFIFEDIHEAAKTISEISGVATRGISFAHIQRGGIPSAQEKILATRMGIKSVELLLENKSGFAVGEISGSMKAIPIMDALKISRRKRVELTNKINKINQA